MGDSDGEDLAIGMSFVMWSLIDRCHHERDCCYQVFVSFRPVEILADLAKLTAIAEYREDAEMSSGQEAVDAGTEGDILMMWQMNERGDPTCTSLAVAVGDEGKAILTGKKGSWLLAPMTYNPKPGEIPEAK